MKICFVDLFIDLECSGGSMHSLDLYATTLAKMGHDVSILTFYPKRNIGFDRKKKPYKIIEDKLDIRSSFALTVGLAKLLKKHERFDVFHFHDPRLLLGAALYRRAGGKVPVVGDLNTYLFQRKNFGRQDIFSWSIRFLHAQRLRLIGKYCDMLFPVSPVVERIYSEEGITHKKMTMIPDGFDFTLLKRAKMKKDESTFNVLYLGRLEHTKGVDVTIKALARLDFPIKFHVAGEGPEKENLKRLAAGLGIGNEVIFHGFVSSKKMNELYSIADVFVHAARWEEAFGRAIVEAMHFGVPVIVSGIGAPPWVADDACLIFKPEDDGALAEAINRLRFDFTLAKRLSKNCVRRAKYFDVKNTCEKFVQAYGKVSGKRSFKS